MKIKEIISFLESWAPPSYQESYDNSGLICGDKNWDFKGLLCTLDCLEQTIEEAIEKDCNLIVAHHPIVFKGLKKINGKNYVERVVIKAIKNDIAIFAIHTNLDNVHNGVNSKIADRIGLQNQKVLIPKKTLLRKLEVYCPTEEADKVRTALFELGAGDFTNYSHCSFNLHGQGTFMPNDKASPHIGEKNVLHKGEEIKVELVFPAHLTSPIMHKLNEVHPYEEVAYQLLQMENEYQFVGSGMIGMLENEMTISSFFDLLKSQMNVSVIRHTKTVKEQVRKIALMGGSGSFGLAAAKAQGADVYLSADFKYHEFFDADNQIVIADIGHYESEAFTIELLSDRLKEKFPNFVVLLTEINTNPVNYY
ncbi:MAG: Nif3-like dinuclear metal center hexameric protein [Bacteroidota bacterium]